MSRADDTALKLAARKRSGAVLGDGEIDALIGDYTAGAISDDAMTQWLRAVCAAGMSIDETASLTRAMAASGETIDWSGLGGAIVDKHSTGGVGDAVTLVAVPLAAACGAQVAKLSGGALGHTGGTLDKIECVPGARIDLSVPEFKRQVARVGCAVAAASAGLAPADKKLYALRDRTGTVESIPLIAASIMSKKLAAGAPAIVLDVKVGAGAFMQEIGAARELARMMVELGLRAGKRVRVLLTAMDAPLADAVGDALELDQALLVLEGGGGERLREVSCAIAAAMVEISGAAPAKGAIAAVEAALRDGSARAKLAEMLAAQGGSLDRFDRNLPEGASVTSPEDGYVTGIDARAIGEVVAHAKRGQSRDVARRLGVRIIRRVGEAVRAGDTVLRYIGAEPSPEILRSLYQTVHVGRIPSEAHSLVLGFEGTP